MGRSRIGWAASAIAPWALALGLLVSLAAHADPDPETGGLTIPPRVAALEVKFSGDAKLIEARYVVGDREDLGAVPDEIEPRFAHKAFKFAAPVINRAHRGDPFVALRPGFEARARAREMNFAPDSTSPDGARPEPARFTFSDGAAPALPLAFALASASPQPPDGRLMAAGSKASTPGAQSVLAVSTDLSDRPGYAMLIDPKDAARQLRCLAEAIYFEARSEPEAGQAAVAQVVLNRVRSGIYPTTVCGVVYQDRQRPFACQFSFACEGKSLRVEEAGPWATATRIAEGVAKGTNYDAKFASAINYHATYVRPFWAPALKRLDRVGMHIFYAMRPGLYWAPGALNGRGDLPPLVAQAAPGPQAALASQSK
jgi:hypothetical protein